MCTLLWLYFTGYFSSVNSLQKSREINLHLQIQFHVNFVKTNIKAGILWVPFTWKSKKEKRQNARHIFSKIDIWQRRKLLNFFFQAFGKFLRGCKRPTFGLQNRFRRTSRWMVKRSHTKCKSKFTLFIFQDFFFKSKNKEKTKNIFHVNLSLGFGSSGLCIFAWSRGSLTMFFTFIISKEFW